MARPVTVPIPMARVNRHNAEANRPAANGVTRPSGNNRTSTRIIGNLEGASTRQNRGTHLSRDWSETHSGLRRCLSAQSLAAQVIRSHASGHPTVTHERMENRVSSGGRGAPVFSREVSTRDAAAKAARRWRCGRGVRPASIAPLEGWREFADAPWSGLPIDFDEKNFFAERASVEIRNKTRVVRKPIPHPLGQPYLQPHALAPEPLIGSTMHSLRPLRKRF
jgi:hypothetical protein